MKKIIIFAAACVALAACQKEAGTVVPTGNGQAKVALSLSSTTKAQLADTENEAKVNSIQAFIFNGATLDAYDYATEDEITAQVMEVSCTQGQRDIWVIVNAPSLATVTTLSGLKEAVSNLTADNTATNYVMVGKAENESVTEEYAKTIYVDRVASKIRLFQVKRDMANASLQTVDFKIVRVFVTNAVDNSCYDVFTPTAPATLNWLSAQFANDGAIAVSNAFLYYKFAEQVAVTNGETYGTTEAPVYSYYVYPNAKSAKDTGDPVTFDQTKLVVECFIDSKYYTYPIPMGAVEYNKCYDINLLTITKLGNPSDGDDDIDDGEDDIITPATATFTISVNDWDQVLTFGGVTDGNITI